MTIGELALRLRVTTRTLRHYEQCGLLLPHAVDARTGYRSYSAAELVRGMRIEQLKAAGLSLATIGQVLAGDARSISLLHQRDVIEAELAVHRLRLATIDALLAATPQLEEPTIGVVPAGPALVEHVVVAHTEMAVMIRRTVQRLRRAARAAGATSASFSARFPLVVESGSVDLHVAAHLDRPVHGGCVLPEECRLGVVVVGPPALLPVAYDAVLTTAQERRLQLSGTVVEHYLDIGRVGRTEVAVVLG